MRNAGRSSADGNRPKKSGDDEKRKTAVDGKKTSNSRSAAAIAMEWNYKAHTAGQ